ncbi:MAG: DUF2510 domain-containing protein [Mycobacteriales bacterium]
MSDPKSPGWYPDPIEPGVQRWWDGERWAEIVRPAEAAADDPVEDEDAEAAVDEGEPTEDVAGDTAGDTAGEAREPDGDEEGTDGDEPAAEAEPERRGLSQMAKIRIAVAGVVVVLVAVGLVVVLWPGKDSRIKASTWIDGFCSKSLPANKAISKAYNDLQTAAGDDAADPTATRTRVSTDLRTIGDSAGSQRGTISRLGTPKVKNGSKIVTALQKTADARKKVSHQWADKVDALAVTDKAKFKTDLTSALNQFQQQLSQAAVPVNSPELSTASQKSKACAAAQQAANAQ